MSGRVVVAGAVAVEEWVRWERLPAPSAVRRASRVDLMVGGSAAVASVAASAAGAATRCVGVVGTDPAGAAVRQHLARADVDVTALVPLPGPTARVQRALAADSLVAAEGEDGTSAAELLLLPGAGWGPGPVAADVALARCEPGDVLLLEWSTLEEAEPLVAAAYELDLQIVALLSPYPLLPQALDLPLIDVAVVDQTGGAHLADAGELPGSLCVLVGQEGLSWDGETVLAPPARSGLPADRRHAVLAGALAGRLACGDDRPEAAARALELAIAAAGGAAPWRRLRLDLEELG